MDRSNQEIPPIILFQVLHNAFPRFADKSSQGGFQQQDANECWTELVRMLQQKLDSKKAEGVVTKFRLAILIFLNISSVAYRGFIFLKFDYRNLKNNGVS